MVRRTIIDSSVRNGTGRLEYTRKHRLNLTYGRLAVGVPTVQNGVNQCKYVRPAAFPGYSSWCFTVLAVLADPSIMSQLA